MNVFNSKFLTVFLLILSVWILFSVISAEIEKDEVKKQNAAIQTKITDISQNNRLMEGYIKNFENQKFLEKEARLRLNYKLPDEEVVFVHRDANSQKTSLSKDISPVELSKYKKWWRWLLGF